MNAEVDDGAESAEGEMEPGGTDASDEVEMEIEAFNDESAGGMAEIRPVRKLKLNIPREENILSQEKKKW